MISFKEYHKQMEILNEMNNTEFAEYKAAKEAKVKSLTSKKNINKYIEILNKKIEELNKPQSGYDQSEAHRLKTDLKNRIKELEERLEELSPDETDDTNTPEKKEDISEDTNSDYQWLYNEWKSSKIAESLKYKKSLPAKSNNEMIHKAIEYYIFSEIAFNKLDKEITSNTVSPKVNIEGKEIIVTRTKDGLSTDKNRGEIANNFFDYLKTLKNIVFGNSFKIRKDEGLKKYINEKYKKIDLNKESDRKKVIEDVEKGNIWSYSNKKDPPQISNSNSNSNSNNQNLDSQDSGNLEHQGSNSKTPELSDSAKAGRKVASDPNNVNSLTMNSDDAAIQTAIDGTFGTEDPSTPGNFFIAAIEKAKKGRERIAKDVESDNKYINSVTDRKKELNSSIVVHENVLLKELQSNPLLKEEYEILQEKLFGPEGERTKTRWSKKLGKDDDGSSGDLSEYRLKKRNEAIKAFGKIKNRYVGNSTRADAVNKIQKIGNEYMSGLNQRVNSLIEKGDYGPITSLIRDIKVANADRITKKNENYAATGYGKQREVEEKDITSQLDKLNKDPESIIKGGDQKYYKNIFSLWAMLKKSRFNFKNLYTLDHPSKDLINDLGPMEKNVIDRLVDFGKKYIYSGIDERLFSHVSTLLLNGKYNNLVDEHLGVSLRNKLENELKTNKNTNNNQEENSQEENSQENANSQENNLNKVKEDLKKAKEEEGVSFNSVDNGLKAIKLLDDLAKTNADNNSKRKVASEIIGYPSPKDTTWKITNNLNMKPEIANLLVNKIRNTKGLQWGIELINNDNKAKTLPAPKENNNSNSEEQKIKSLINDPYKNNYTSIKEQIQNSNLDDDKKQILMKDLFVREILNRQKGNLSTISRKNIFLEAEKNKYFNFIKDLNIINNDRFKNKTIKDPQNGKEYKWDNKKIIEVTGEQTAGSQTAGEQTAGEQTAGSQTAGSQTAGEQTAGEQTAGEQTEKAVNQNSKYLGNIIKDKLRSLFARKDLENKANNKNFYNAEKTDEYVDRLGSVVTEDFILTEEGEPISKSGAEAAVLKALSLNAQEAAEGKQWIIDNIYKGNPLASKIVDKFVEENSNKRNQAAKALEADKQAKQQAINNGTPKQVATAMQGTGAVPQQAGQPQQAINNQQNAQPVAGQQPTSRPVANQQASTQQSTAPQQNKPVNATVTTAAADGFPNRLYKKIIRRKIGF